MPNMKAKSEAITEVWNLVKSNFDLSLFDLDLWPTTLTKVKVDPNAKYEGHKWNGTWDMNFGPV